MGKTVVKRPSFVEQLEHLLPLIQHDIVVALLDLHFVKPVVLSPVWPRLELSKECVFHHLLKLVSAKSSGEEWYLGKINPFYNNWPHPGKNIYRRATKLRVFFVTIKCAFFRSSFLAFLHPAKSLKTKSNLKTSLRTSRVRKNIRLNGCKCNCPIPTVSSFDTGSIYKRFFA